jgi:hypothetical protein
LHHVGGDLAGVERVAATFGDRAQRLAEFRLTVTSPAAAGLPCGNK